MVAGQPLVMVSTVVMLEEVDVVVLEENEVEMVDGGQMQYTFRTWLTVRELRTRPDAFL